MLLSSICISGYRGFSNEVKIHLSLPNGDSGSGLSAIVGSNNSGKTSIIECIRYINNRETPNFSSNIRNIKKSSVSIDYEFIDQTKIKICSVESGSSMSTISPLNHGKKIIVVPAKRSISHSFQRNSFDLRNYLSQQNQHGMRNPSLNLFETRIFSHIYENKIEFNEIMSRILGYDFNWTIDSNEMNNHYIRIIKPTSSHSSEGAGEGIISLFVIVGSCIESKNDNPIVVIDEPELSLHPQIQRRLFDYIKLISSSRQVIISTHSPYFVDSEFIANGGRVLRAVDENGDTSVYQLCRLNKDFIELIRKDWLFPHLFDLNAREIFFQTDKVILVEGQEDVIGYKAIETQLSRNFNANFYGWGIGGAGNASKFLATLSSLGYKKVSIILDGNKSKEFDELKKLYKGYSFHILPTDNIIDKSEKTLGILDSKLSLKKEYMEFSLSLINDVNAYMSED